MELILVLKYFILQLPAVVLCAVLYFRVVLKLKTGVENSSKTILTITFIVLWIFWVLLSLPYAVFEILLRLILRSNSEVFQSTRKMD